VNENKEDASKAKYHRAASAFRAHLSESMVYVGYFANLPVQPDASSFGLPSEWSLAASRAKERHAVSSKRGSKGRGRTG
jgi:hypothetical protein